MNHASIYCKTLDNVSHEELVNALHQALMQLNAVTKEARELGSASFLDNKPAIAEASRIMAKAGHVGFPIPQAT